MFQIGDYIIYGTNGVCRVEEIGSVDLPNISKDKLYYTLSPIHKPGGQIFTPVDNQRIVMRPILTREETTQLFSGVEKIAPLEIFNERTVERLYRDLLNSCDCEKWIQIIKTIYLRQQSRMRVGKKITAVDDRYMRLAEDNLYGELSVVLEKSRDELYAYIMDRIAESSVDTSP